MKITKKEFSNEINFEDVGAGQVFHFGNNYHMAFGREVFDDECDKMFNAIRLNDGQLVCFGDEQPVAVIDNAELIVVG